MTEQLYYTDPRLSSFEATVLEQVPEGNRWAVILDRTAFYPEGGGQPADRGQLNDLPVIDVQKQGEEIRHYLRQPLERGTLVRGTIDWPRRFEFMQQHTGQHIVSASLIQAAGYATVSAYLGERYTAVEIDTDDIREEETEAAATLANQHVTRNLAVRIHWIRPQEAEGFHLRKPPPDVERLRVVQIEGIDAAACAGIHVNSTGEVGLIKYDGLEKIRGRLRLHWLIGERAYRDTWAKDRLVAALNRELTCGTEDILPSVQELKRGLREREQRISQLERILAEQRVRSLLDGAQSRKGIRMVRQTFTKEEPSFAEIVFQNLLELPGTVACILCRREPGFQWWIGCSQDLDVPWKRILPALFPLIDGKGGGRGKSWQGIGRNIEGEAGFLESLQEAVWNLIPGGANG